MTSRCSPSRILVSILCIVALTLVAVACSGQDSPQNSTQPAYWPTYADYASIALPSPGGLSTVVQDIIKSRFLNYVSVYIAQECISGNDRTADAFREFVLQREPSIESRAEAIAGEMLAQPRQQIEGTCVQAYLYPETTAQLALASNLAITVYEGRIPIVLQRGLRRITVDQASSWFGSVPAQSNSLLLALIGESTTPPAQNTAVTPIERPLNPPEVWVLGLRVRELERCASGENKPRC